MGLQNLSAVTMALAACEVDDAFSRFDGQQKRVIRALCDASKPHLVVTGGAGSGKTTTVNFAIKKLAMLEDVSVLRVAVSDLTAERFGGGDAVNLMLFFSIVDSFCGGRVHYTAEENPAVASFLRGLARGRVLVAIDEFGLMSAANLTRVVTLLWRACGEVAGKFANVQIVLIGDPAGQMPPISGDSVVFSSAFKNHPSAYVRRVIMVRLEGQHRFSASAREHMRHVLTCDVTSRDQFIASQKAKYAKEEFWHTKTTLLKSRKGCEGVIRKMSNAFYGSIGVEEVSFGCPKRVLGTRQENESKFTAGSFLMPHSDDAIVIEVTAWSNRIFAVSTEDADVKVKVNNRQRFFVSAGSFHDLPAADAEDGVMRPPEKLGSAAPSVSVFIDGAEHRIPVFVSSGKDESPILGIRQIGFATPSGDGQGHDILGMALLLFNTQGDQFPGKKIVLGAETDATGGSCFSLADFNVGVSRTSDPALCLIHPSAKVFESKEETRKYTAIKKELQRLEETLKSRKREAAQPPGTAPRPQRRRSKFSSSFALSSSLPRKQSPQNTASQSEVFW